LGDGRRVRRLIEMGMRAAEHPAGRVSDVFRCARAREAAYDFVENEAISGEEICSAAAAAGARAASR
jgi:hypothetical protein